MTVCVVGGRGRDGEGVVVNELEYRDHSAVPSL